MNYVLQILFSHVYHNTQKLSVGKKRSLYYQFQQCDSICKALWAPFAKMEVGRKERREEGDSIPNPKVYNSLKVIIIF